jgi:1-pyrroline-5-carboxylate dehydrogenase
METELFGPVISFEDAKWEETLELVDSTSGIANRSCFSQDRYN